MTPRRVWYINYIDPKTGFLRHEEYNSHRDMEARATELRAQGVTHLTKGASKFLRT